MTTVALLTKSSRAKKVYSAHKGCLLGRHVWNNYNYCMQLSLHFNNPPPQANFQRAPNDPQMTLTNRRSRVPHICITTVPESQISVRFALRWAVFEIMAVFHFPIDYNVKFKFLITLVKMKISEIPNVVLWRPSPGTPKTSLVAKA